MGLSIRHAFTTQAILFLLCTQLIIADNIFKDIDNELLQATHTVEDELGGNIKRGFSNIGVKQTKAQMLNDSQNKFQNITIQALNNQIILTNLKFHRIYPRMLKAKPNLIYNVMVTEFDLNDVILRGDFEIYNTDLIEMIPLVNRGTIEIHLNNVHSKGLVGFARQGDVYYSENLDLDYDFDAVQIKFLQLGQSQPTIIERATLDETFLETYQYEIWTKISSLIQRKVNQVLGDISIHDTLRGDEDVLIKYFERADRVNRFVNDVIDNFLVEVRDTNVLSNASYYRIPDVSTKFTFGSGPFTQIGEFQASDGYFGNLETFVRRSNFSLFFDEENEAVRIFGSIGVDDLRAGFGNYNAQVLFIKPAGSIRMKAGYNEVRMSLKLPSMIHSKPDLQKVKLHVNIVELDDVDVAITGLNDRTLDWLASKITTFMIGTFKTRILSAANDEIRRIIDAVLLESMDAFPFPAASS